MGEARKQTAGPRFEGPSRAVYGKFGDINCLANPTWTRHTVGLHLQTGPRQLARGRVAGQGAQSTVQTSDGLIQAEERPTTTRQRNRTFMVRMIRVASSFK